MISKMYVVRELAEKVAIFAFSYNAFTEFSDSFFVKKVI